MISKFIYSRCYIFESGTSRHKRYLFTLVERFGEVAAFRMSADDTLSEIPAPVDVVDGVETASFLYFGKEYFLRADRFIPKSYAPTLNGRLERNDDRLKDAHLHTIYNREEILESKISYCICCQTFLHPSEIDDYADDNQTAICPYCGTDSVIGDASGIRLTDDLLARLHKEYF